MAIDVLAGQVGTGNVLADELKVDMSEDIAMLTDDQTQFTTMLMKVAKKTTNSIKPSWLEDDYFPRVSALAASATSAASTMVVTTGEGAFFRARDVVRNVLTGEAFQVLSVSTDTLTIAERGLGGVTAASSASGAQLVIVSNASREGSDTGERKMRKKVLGFNWTQIHRHEFEFTGTNTAVARYGPDEPDHEAKKKLVEHKRSLEATLFDGVRDVETVDSDTQPTRYAGGLLEFISTNVTPAAGAIDKDDLDEFMFEGMQYGNQNSYVFFCAPVIALAISSFLRDAWHPATVSQRLWGAKVDGFISGAWGNQVPVVVKREWGGDFVNSGGGWGGRGFLIDMSAVKYRPMVGRDTAFWPNQQGNGVDGVISGYRTEASLEVRQEKRHALITGVTGAGT